VTDQATIRAITGTIIVLEQHTTRQGQRWVTITLDHAGDTTDLHVLPNDYAVLHEHLVPDATVTATGDEHNRLVALTAAELTWQAPVPAPDDPADIAAFIAEHRAGLTTPRPQIPGGEELDHYVVEGYLGTLVSDLPNTDGTVRSKGWYATTQRELATLLVATLAGARAGALASDALTAGDQSAEISLARCDEAFAEWGVRADWLPSVFIASMARRLAATVWPAYTEQQRTRMLGYASAYVLRRAGEFARVSKPRVSREERDALPKSVWTELTERHFHAEEYRRRLVLFLAYMETHPGDEARPEDLRTLAELGRGGRPDLMLFF
jgi:hypothetical protein